MKPSIVCVDRSLTPDDFKAVSEFAIDAAYTYGEQDEDRQKPTGMVCELDPECCTEFYLDDRIIGIPPVPNTLLKFTSWVTHRATPLNSDHRFTYALKYCRENN